MKSNVVFIGMPGVGKSTIGVVLAKKMGYAFLDSDLIIQEKEGRLLHEIIDEEGIDEFNKIENRINASICCDKSIIATGGSAVYGKEAMEHLRDIGIVVYLSLPYEELSERLGDLHERGVSMREGQSLKELMSERISLYEKYGDITIDCHNKQIREIVEEINTKLNEIEQ